MKKIEISKANEWLSKTEGKLVIKEELFFRGADLFLNQFSDIHTKIKNCLELDLKNLFFYTSKRKNDEFFCNRRIKADSLNRALKSNLSQIESLKFEVQYNEGYLIDSPQTGGFDFALYDELFNINNFRNYCYGKKPLYKGEQTWNKILEAKPKWDYLVNSNAIPTDEMLGEDNIINKKEPTIIGEIQLGNWALLYYDLLKTIHIENLLDIDLFIYITPTGDLQEYISDGTVNFNKVKKAIEEYHSILKMPIWLVGIDINT
ncbi:hypothetical protein AC622_06970 [Bacillus sp. FJAT-27916]|uniref:BglII/BstYI family type II restriction endonuclease n=1 Tax=Bacillus sp. FJAT-27916 TaxID=1679169 RepID=UPI00067168E8|nr:BglII/BstYI family type II restriction endonuclease [Bacillus sp. FJAT-27916]KMY44023.1 hypothetical protein AC622_06970 [Bacillus sp. FJAT-27916]